MPRGPKGEKRSADVIGNAVHVMRIATGETEDLPSKTLARAKDGKIGPKRLALLPMPAGKSLKLNQRGARLRHP